MDKNRIAMVTGATSGIGRSCAIKLAGAGYKVIITGRRADKLHELGLELADHGADVFSLNFDVRDLGEARRAVDSLPDEWRQIDVLVNNAGLALGLEPLDKGDTTDWDTMIDTNIKGLLYMSRLILPGMLARNRGHIVNIGSVAGDAAYAGGSVYCASKAAVKVISDGLRIDVADSDIKVTDVKPGLVETDFSRVRFHGDKERADNVYKGIDPLHPDDIADVVLYAVQAPANVQIAEVLVLATRQGSGSVICRH